MSIAAPPRIDDVKISQTRPALRPTIRQPLQQLQSGIRRYVVIEALAVLVCAVTIWGLTSLILDWGIFFQLFHFDYIYDAATSIRGLLRGSLFLILVGVAGWVLVWYLFLRMSRRLTEWELALVLERKYGRELGDRLVTAVELSNFEGSVEQGYSRSMLEATTHEAEERLQNLPIVDVFNRPRLIKRIVIALGCFILAVGSFLLLPEITQTWAERNLFFHNLPWPRPLILEITDFPERTKAIPFGSELKVTIRSPKWAVADQRVREGWRALRWSDLESIQSAPVWELEGITGQKELYEVLPRAWLQLTLDQIEARLQENLGTLHHELGLELIQKCLVYLKEHEKDSLGLAPSLGQFFPEKLRQMSVAEQKVALAAGATLSAKDAERIAAGMTTLRPVVGDALLNLCTLSTHPIVNPLPCFSALQKVAYDRDRDLPALAISENDRRLLPATWEQKLAIRDLVKRLRTFAAEESADSLGQNVLMRLQHFFEQLDERATRTRFATRKTFRKLIVPEKITLEFENIVDAEERAMGRAKRGQPELKRLPMTNDYQYDFKKVERPMRLRAYAASVATPWFRVDVKPLPTLQKLLCWRDEPAYLHSSLRRVNVGPVVLSLDGEETRAEAPQGSIVWFEGESHKPLRAVRAITENPADTPVVRHKPGEIRFTIRPQQGRVDDLQMRLEFEDQDGIQAVRKLFLIFTPDKPPEFVKAQFEAVNRKFVTPQAILPLSVQAKDDIGLLAMEYEVSIQKNDHSVVHDVRLPFRLFSPLRLAVFGTSGLQTDLSEETTLSMVGYFAQLTAGWPALVPPFHSTLRREFAHDYIDKNLHGPVISIEDEFLDTLLIRAALGKPVDKPLLGTPYRMVVRLVARDNRMREEGNVIAANHQEGKTSEAFEFAVVSEQDVIIEAGRREEDLRDRFEEVIATCVKLRSSLKRIRDDLEVPSQAKDDDVRRAASDAADATKTLATIRNGLDEKVLREFRQVFRELALNRVDSRILDRVDGRICRPLAFLLQPSGLFAKLEESVDTLSRRLDAERQSTPKSVLAEPFDQCSLVLAELDKILQDMKKLIEFNEALRVLRDLINNEQKLIDEMKALIDKKLKDNLDDK